MGEYSPNNKKSFGKLSVNKLEIQSIFQQIPLFFFFSRDARDLPLTVPRARHVSPSDPHRSKSTGPPPGPPTRRIPNLPSSLIKVNPLSSRLLSCSPTSSSPLFLARSLAGTILAKTAPSFSVPLSRAFPTAEKIPPVPPPREGVGVWGGVAILPDGRQAPPIMWAQPHRKDAESGARPLYPMMLEAPELRWAFIRKIYSIVALQLLATIAVGAVVVSVRPIANFFVGTGAGLALYIVLIITPFIGAFSGFLSFL